MRQFFKINSDIVFNNVYLNIKPNACFQFWFLCSHCNLSATHRWNFLIFTYKIIWAQFIYLNYATIILLKSKIKTYFIKIVMNSHLNIILNTYYYINIFEIIKVKNKRLIV